MACVRLWHLLRLKPAWHFLEKSSDLDSSQRAENPLNDELDLFTNSIEGLEQILQVDPFALCNYFLHSGETVHQICCVRFGERRPGMKKMPKPVPFILALSVGKGAKC